MTEKPDTKTPESEKGTAAKWTGQNTATNDDWLRKQVENLTEQLESERRARRDLEQRFAAANLEDDPAVIKARRHLFRQIMHLVPQAIAEAKGQPVGKTGKRGPSRPALLRLIVRTVRLR